MPVDPVAGIEDQTDPVPPYAPLPLALPATIPREERHLYTAHPLTGIRTRSNASSQIEAPRPHRPHQASRPIEALIREQTPHPGTRPSNPSPDSSSSSSSSESSTDGEDRYNRLFEGPIEDLRRAATNDPVLGFFFRAIDDMKNQILEGITHQIQEQERRQDTGIATLNTTLQQLTNLVSRLNPILENSQAQAESAAQNAWTAATDSRRIINKQ
ncbi:hypothetical protein RhiLY_02499 [Ceratobasidium sp. AG-Ba]|nr:hypothetical protein RhiLY_02499 [Ceratobasidium sp. AG-Ba]